MAKDITAILDFFRQGRKGAACFSVARLLKTFKDRFSPGRLFAALGELVEAGQLIRIGDVYGLAEKARLIQGHLKMFSINMGVLRPESGEDFKIYIAKPDLGGALSGDLVEAAAFESGRREKTSPKRSHHASGKNNEYEPRGRVINILERARQVLPVRLIPSGPAKSGPGADNFLFQSTDPKANLTFLVQDSKFIPEAGAVFKLRIGEYLSRDFYQGKIEGIFGHENEPDVQERLVKDSLGICEDFPGPVLKEAAALPADPSLALEDEDLPRRIDLSAEAFLTIDGDDSRDFDDAIFVRREQHGFTLFTAIADVAHYVRPGSALDREARERGNSFYFPRSTAHMFPRELSEGLASLKPGTPRLAMVVRMRFDAAGRPLPMAEKSGHDFFPAIIISKARLTYQKVNKAVFENDAGAQAELAPTLPMLRVAADLAGKMRRLREERGALTFDLPEPQYKFGPQGELLDILPRDRGPAQNMIEEFMIATNVSVARFLDSHNLSYLRRVHPPPDPLALEGLAEMVKTLGGQPFLNETAKAKSSRKPKNRDKRATGGRTPLQSVDLKAILNGQAFPAPINQETESLLNRLVLRAMMQARYSPAKDGHFGLALEDYCHFTSPIRRYADLTVHRVLKRALNPPDSKIIDPDRQYKKDLRLAETLNNQERLSVEAEREIRKRLGIIFLQDHQGGLFEGAVSGVTDFGFWVELKNLGIDGLVRLDSLRDDYYRLNKSRSEIIGERTGRRIRLGMPIQVKLLAADIGRLEIDLALASSGEI